MIYTVTLESYEDGSTKQVRVNAASGYDAMAIAESCNTDCVAVEFETTKAMQKAMQP